MSSLLQRLSREVFRRLSAVRGDRGAETIPPNVNPAHGYLFVHIPKTAGTSMCEALGLTETTHATAAEFREMLGESYSQLYSFAFTRNPWDRFLSLYLYARMEESYHHSSRQPRKKRYGKHPDYETLRGASVADAARLLAEGKLGFQWLPQYRWVCDGDGKILCNFVGKFETLEADWPAIAARTHAAASLPRKNVANQERVSYRQVIDARTRAVLDEYYARDIEMFGYEF